MFRRRPNPVWVADAAAQHLLKHDWQYWSVGESIALSALYELDSHQIGTGFKSRHQDYREVVEGVVRPWCREFAGVGVRDHAAPGALLVDLYYDTEDELYLDVAVQLASLHASLPVSRGVAVHQPDRDSLIRAEYMALDGPFLARLGAVTESEALERRGLDAALGYAEALLDHSTHLFRHGFDTESGRQSECSWARGNGWALYGLIETLAELSEEFPGSGRLLELICGHVTALVSLQDASGHWHAILDDPSSQLESSATALFVATLNSARRHGFVERTRELNECLRAALAALYAAAGSDGALVVSGETPVGSRNAYLGVPTGVFPWGQGALILAMLEATRM